MDADAIVRFIWNDEASRPSREAFAKMYDYMQANPDPLPDGVVRKRPAQETSPVPVWPVTQHFDCHKCAKHRTLSYMIVCPTCGNKRCPKASDHELACTNSNAPGQPGSIY